MNSFFPPDSTCSINCTKPLVGLRCSQRCYLRVECMEVSSRGGYHVYVGAYLYLQMYMHAYVYIHIYIDVYI